ncbi:MAG: DMT family transporter [Hyphomicrobiaceae bacterium]
MTTSQHDTGATARENVVAIIAMVASQAVFTVNDALMKLAAREVPGGEAIFIRGITSIILSGALAAHLGAFRNFGELIRQWRLVTIRNLGEVGATLLYLTALFHMPIADATAILQALPLAITAAAALVFGEPVGWRRWLATAVGLAGVLVVIRPGTSAVNPWSLVALAAVAAVVTRDLSTRRIHRGVPTILLTFISSIAVALMALAQSLFETWHMPNGRALTLGTSAAVFVIAGYFLVIEAMRRGEVAVVAPFRYSGIIWAIIAGIIIFGEWPDRLALLGTAVIISAGLYTFFRERKLNIQRGRP